jgi:prevent-host-death family protein
MWTVATAKAHLSEVIEHALQDGPQTITRNGKHAVVVVSLAEWETKTKRKGTLADFFAESPLRNSKLVIERSRDKPREIDL